jgi:O-antigen/teichoic acid export membrane protein
VSVVPTQATRGHAFRDVVVQVGTRVLNLALGIFVTAVLVRTLGASGYGQWMTMLTVFQLLGYFTSFGLEAVTVREAASDPEAAENWVGALVLTRLALSLPVVVIGFAVLLFVREGNAMLVAGIILLLEIPLGVGTSLQVVHQLRMDNKVPMAILTANSVLWGAAVVLVNVLGGGLVALAIALTAATAFTSLMQALTAVRLLRFRLRPSRAAMVRLVRLGAPLGVAGLLVIAYARIDQVIVFEQVGAEASGQYGAAYRVLEQAHFVPVSVITTLAPLMASLWPGHRARMLRIVTMAAEALSIGSLGALAFAVVAARPLMRFFFGEDLVAGAPALPVLGAAFVVICFGYLSGNLLLVLGLARKQVTVALLGLIANVAGNLVLVPRYGFMAAAWMTLVTEAVVVSVGFAFVLRRLGRPWPSLGRLPRIALAGGLLLVALLGLRHAFGEELVVLSVGAAVLYPALLLALRAVSPGEVRTLLRGDAV